MMDVLFDLYELALMRKANPEEGSYTCYLFEKGLDKILKKVGEETAETLIAAKNKNPDELANEICDLIYHLLVLMANEELPLARVEEILIERRKKQGNLKTMRATDTNT